MAFIASQITLQKGLDEALNVANQEKAILNNWNAQLAGNITGIDAMNMLANLKRVLEVFSRVSVLPGLAVYAQQQFGNDTYDVAAEFTTMVNALTATETWLKTNIPSNAVSIVNGQLTGATYTPAQTASLKSLVIAAAATID
jgi:hypothetical protein